MPGVSPRRSGSHGSPCHLIPGIACAIGLLQTDIVHVYMQSLLVRIDRAGLADLGARFDDLVDRATTDVSIEGFGPEEVHSCVRSTCATRIRATSSPWTVPFESSDRAATSRQLRRAFDRLHEQIYGVAAPGEPVEIVNLRIRAVVPVESPATAVRDPRRHSPEAAKIGERERLLRVARRFPADPAL